MDHLSLDTGKMAQVVINAEAFLAKANGTLAKMDEGFQKLKPESEQSRHFHKIMQTEIEDIKTGPGAKLKNIAEATAELRSELEKLENSDEIFSAARSSMTEANKAGKVRPKL